MLIRITTEGSSSWSATTTCRSWRRPASTPRSAGTMTSSSRSCSGSDGAEDRAGGRAPRNGGFGVGITLRRSGDGRRCGCKNSNRTPVACRAHGEASVRQHRFIMVGVASSEALTFVFTDLESSTRLWEEFPDAMKAAVERHDAILRVAVEGCRGRVVKLTGDGLMAIFPSPADGVEACLEAQRALRDEAWGEPGPLRVRMGMHAGEAQQRGGDF